MPDYSSQQYWRTRLLGEDREGFEWLISAESIIPLVASLLRGRHPHPARLLHFGCGSSALGAHMQRHFGERVNVYDADYAISGTERKFLSSQEVRGEQRPRVLHFDALVLRDLIDCAPAGGWDVLVDKSTADAIACGEPLVMSSDDGSVSPAREPIEVLCENLHHVTSANAAWLCISYSSSRFDFLSGAEQRHGWRVESKAPIGLVKSEETALVHRPETGTWAWILRRA